MMAGHALSAQTRAVLLLIAGTTLARLLFAQAVGLGVDESYMVSAGRVASLGYFDHPPIAWWLSRGAAWLAGSEAAVMVRLPFIALFALTTWLMFRLGTVARDERAGFWAAAALNMSPVFGITSGTWVLPDGPLDCALVGAALCLAHAVQSTDRAPWRWWIGAGLCAGLALSSKYSAGLTIAGAILFLAVSRPHRIWLRRPQPWLAGVLAALIFSPVILWNAQHDWASFAFQGARAAGLRFRPLAPLEVLAGGALFVLPWIWAAMMPLWLRALRGGGATDRLLAFLAAPPIIVFALVAAWSSQRVLFHWAAPGYLMLFPLLGAWIADRMNQRWMRQTVAATATLALLSVAVISAHTYLDLLGSALGRVMRKDPTIEGVDWTSVHDDLWARGLLRPGTVVGVPNWRDAGKIARGLGPAVTVIVLNRDARQFGVVAPASDWVGHDILILALGNLPLELAGATLAPRPLPPSPIRLRGRDLAELSVFQARLAVWPPPR